LVPTPRWQEQGVRKKARAETGATARVDLLGRKLLLTSNALEFQSQFSYCLLEDQKHVLHLICHHLPVYKVGRLSLKTEITVSDVF
jgi:hypothetical protein